MIYLFYGTDTDKARLQANTLATALLKKKPDASFFKIIPDEWDLTRFEEYVRGQGLFQQKYIVLTDRIAENKDIREEFVGFVADMAESPHIFLVLEGKLDKKSLTTLTKHAKEVKEFVKKEEKKPEYNNFAMADALGRRDRKELWVLYREAIERGEAVEAIHGMLFWKVKNMLMKKMYGKYSEREVRKLLDDLIMVSHDSRRGKHELETALEALLLQV